jgi:hypothetical protein
MKKVIIIQIFAELLYIYLGRINVKGISFHILINYNFKSETQYYGNELKLTDNSNVDFQLLHAYSSKFHSQF